MAQINNAGQVYVANGVVNINTSNGQYLAVGNPLVYVGSEAAPIGNTTFNFVLPVGVRSIIINDADSMANIGFYIYGHQSNILYGSVDSKGTGPMAIHLPPGPDTSIDVTIVNRSASADTVYIWWSFSIDDFGFSALNDSNGPHVPSSYGAYSVITNRRVPVRFGDDVQPMQVALLGPITAAGGTLVIASPGAGNSIVLWQSSIRNVGTGNSEIVDSGGVLVNTTDANSVGRSSNTVVHGGLKIRDNSSINLSTDGGTFIQCSIWYTVEAT